MMAPIERPANETILQHVKILRIRMVQYLKCKDSAREGKVTVNEGAKTHRM
jgi:hypothetical protein